MAKRSRSDDRTPSRPKSRPKPRSGERSTGERAAEDRTGRRGSPGRSGAPSRSAIAPPPPPVRPRGTLVLEPIVSEALRGNPLGDPHERPVHVWLPPSARSRTGADGRRFPVVVLLTGFTGLGESPWQRQAYGEALHERLDRLVAEGAIPEMIVAVPDCMTAIGGSQYVDSSAIGRYETHVVEELVPWLDARFPTKPAARHRAVCGKSSGGYGALMLTMKHPDVFGSLASHSGDAYFEYCYGYDFVKCWDGLREAGGVREWLAQMRRKTAVRTKEVLVLNVLAMAAAYSPNPDSPWTFDLPFDLETGEMDPRVMLRWRAFDPVHACRRYAKGLRGLRGIYLDCGMRDEFALHAGTRILAKRLREIGVEAAGVPLVHEEFDDGHMGISYRYDHSLPWLGRWTA